MTALRQSAPNVPANAPAKSAASRILALDYGQKRIGLAISDESRLTAQPLAALARTNRRDDVTRLRALIRERNVGELIIGLPLHLDGRASNMSAEVRRFAERLRKQLALPIQFVDERLTSWDAENERLATGSVKDRDSLAAAIILRDYLAQSARTSAAVVRKP